MTTHIPLLVTHHKHAIDEAYVALGNRPSETERVRLLLLIDEHTKAVNALNRETQSASTRKDMSHVS